MFPLADSMNHRPLTKVTWKSVDGALELISGEDILTGEEIFNNYGPKSNEERYGFCFEKNPFDYVVIKVNFFEDPQASAKLSLLSLYGLSSLKHFIQRDNIPSTLLRQLRIALLNSAEIRHLQTSSPSTGAIDFVCYRNELAMLQMFNDLLRSKLEKLVRTDPGSPEEGSISSQTFALMYRNGQLDILSNAITRIQDMQHKVINSLVAELESSQSINTGKFPTKSPYECTLPRTVTNIEDSLITPKSILSAGDDFSDAIKKIFEDIEGQEEVILILYLIRECARKDSKWKNFLSNARVNDINIMYQEESLEELRDIYEQLFPASSEAFPEIFDQVLYTFENFQWADIIVNEFSINIRDEDRDIVCIVPF